MSKTVAEVKKKRTAAKAWVTKTVRKLKELLEAKDVDLEALQAVKRESEQRLETLDNIQSEVELAFESEPEMLTDIETAAEFREGIVTILCKATKALNCIDVASSSQSASDILKLPKLELPKFDGDVLKWQSFWECYEAYVHCSELHDVTKFAYLKSLLKGEAQECIAGLPLTAANYSSACELLKNRFGSKEVITFSHIQQLLSVPEAQSSVTSLRELQDRLLTHIRSLESLDIGGDRYGVILVPLILSKLSPDIRLEWAREGSGKEADLSRLMTFLSSEIERRERSAAYSSMQATPGQTSAADERRAKATSGPQHRRKRSQQRIPAAAAFQTGGRLAYGFCEKSHSPEGAPPPSPRPAPPAAAATPPHKRRRLSGGSAAGGRRSPVSPGRRPRTPTPPPAARPPPPPALPPPAAAAAPLSNTSDSEQEVSGRSLKPEVLDLTDDEDSTLCTVAGYEGAGGHAAEYEGGHAAEYDESYDGWNYGLDEDDDENCMMPTNELNEEVDEMPAGEGSEISARSSDEMSPAAGEPSRKSSGQPCRLAPLGAGPSQGPPGGHGISAAGHSAEAAAAGGGSHAGPAVTATGQEVTKCAEQAAAAPPTGSRRVDDLRAEQVPDGRELRPRQPAPQPTVSAAPPPTVSPAPEQPAEPAGSLRPRQRKARILRVLSCPICAKPYREKIALINLRRHLTEFHREGPDQADRLASRAQAGAKRASAKRRQRTVSPAPQCTVSAAPQPTVSPAPERPAEPTGSLRPRQRKSRNRDKPYCCLLCPKQYGTKVSLVQHHYQHEGLTRCPRCDKVTTRLTDLRRHMATEHQMNTEEVRRAVPDRRYK